MMSQYWKWWHTLALLLILVAIVGVGALLGTKQVVLMWLLILALMAGFAIIAGLGLTGKAPLGWLIDEQYTMSLSRLQMFLWTVVVLSAFLAAVFVNIKANHSDVAVNVGIPEQVWLAMGISTISLVGSPLILSGKKTKEPNEDKTTETLNRLGISAADQGSHQIGQVYKNTKPEEARLYDLVSGEETVNRDVLDLTRLQNLFFTLILVGAYAITLGNFLAAQVATSTFPITEFPSLADSSVALLAISHAGYLTSKAIDKQKPAQ